MRISHFEKREILKAYAAITLAFGILLWRWQNLGLLSALVTSGITVGTGFVFHELAHKYVAQRYGALAEFRAFNQYLILAIIMSFFGFIIAAPGAVFIQGYVNRERYGRISAAGIVANMIAAAVFLIIFRTTMVPVVKSIGFYGAMINSWLALFNLIPFGQFDGAKILVWNKKVYFILAVIGLVLLFARG